MLTWRFGDIILVSSLPDPQGRNPKDRPAVIIKPPDESDPSLDIMAITTLIPEPPPGDHVLLPWQAHRHPRTGLARRSAAVATWLATIAPERVLRRVGFVPARQAVEIANLLCRLDEANPPEVDG